MRLPPLNALRAFEAAARHASFKLAANELCVTQGAVSRHIARLEEFLGLPLFVRMHRRVALTPDGETYLREVQDALLRIAYATTNLSATGTRNTLTIKSPPTCAIWWLVPRLGRFHDRFPGIQVQLLTSHLPVDFQHEEVDVAVQYGIPDGSGLLADRLFGEVLVPICSQAFLDGLGGARTPDTVASQVLLHSIRRPDDWTDWLDAAGIASAATGQEIVFENSAMTIQGALDGVGVALGQLAFIGGELDTRRLVSPVDLRITGETAYFLVFPRHKERLERVAVFRDWVNQEAEATRRAHPGL